MSGSVIVAGARTPVGRLLGGLKSLSAADLGGVATDAHHRLPHALLLVGLLVDQGHPERLRVELDRGVQVLDRDTGVVDAHEEVGGDVQGG